MNKIPGICVTNIDGMQHLTWPEYFLFPPRVGDYVESLDGTILTVVAVTHTADKLFVPMIKVELAQ